MSTSTALIISISGNDKQSGHSMWEHKGTALNNLFSVCIVAPPKFKS